MDQITILKEKILEHLDGGYAHTPYYKVLDNVPIEIINKKLKEEDHSLYELLEHIRFSHLDIINFISPKKYIEHKWPDEYWPKKGTKATPEMWKKSVEEVKNLYNQTKEMLSNSNIDLFAEVPNGTGQNFLREFLLIAEHNAYHFGQFTSYLKVIKE